MHEVANEFPYSSLTFTLENAKKPSGCQLHTIVKNRVLIELSHNQHHAGSSLKENSAEDSLDELEHEFLPRAETS